MSDANPATVSEVTEVKGAGELLKEVQTETGTTAPAATNGKAKGKGKGKAKAKPEPAVAEPEPEGIKPTLDPLNLPEPELKDVKRKEIFLDKRLQHRNKLQDISEGGAIDQYADKMREGTKFDPVTLVDDVEAKTLWCVDGFQRVGAYTLAKIEDVPAKVYKGNYADAMMLSCASNGENSVLPRTKDDMKRSVFAILDNLTVRAAVLSKAKGNGGIHRVFAEVCKCSSGTVSAALAARNLKAKGGIELVKFTPKPEPEQPPEPKSSIASLTSPVIPVVSPAEQRKADIADYEKIIERDDEFLLDKAMERAKHVGAVFSKYMVKDEDRDEIRSLMAKHGFPISEDFDKEKQEEGKGFSPYHAMLQHWPVINQLCELAREAKELLKTKRDAERAKKQEAEDKAKAEKEAEKEAAKKKKEEETKKKDEYAKLQQQTGTNDVPEKQKSD